MCRPGWSISAETVGNHQALKAFGIAAKLKERRQIYTVPLGLFGGLTLICHRKAGIVLVAKPRSPVPFRNSGRALVCSEKGLYSITQPSTT